MSFSHSIIYKIITAGDGAVGKTTLLRRYVEGKFIFDTQMTLGVEIFTKRIKYKDEMVMLQLWDFGGQEQFRFMLSSYMLGAKGALIMFDLTRYSTINSIDDWVKICRSANPSLPLILIGGKADLVKDIMVSDDIVLEIKKKYNFIDYLKTSAKTGENVGKAFELLVKKISEMIG